MNNDNPILLEDGLQAGLVFQNGGTNFTVAGFESGEPLRNVTQEESFSIMEKSYSRRKVKRVIHRLKDGRKIALFFYRNNRWEGR